MQRMRENSKAVGRLSLPKSQSIDECDFVGPAEEEQDDHVMVNLHKLATDCHGVLPIASSSCSANVHTIEVFVLPYMACSCHQLKQVLGDGMSKDEFIEMIGQQDPVTANQTVIARLMQVLSYHAQSHLIVLQVFCIIVQEIMNSK